MPVVTTKRVLVADDDPGVVSLLQRVLEKAGFNVIVATDGHGAREILEQQELDIAILGRELPRRSGIELTRFVRDTERLAHLPVIVVARRGQDDAAPVLAAGADDYLKVPIDPPGFLRQVRSALSPVPRAHW